MTISDVIESFIKESISRGDGTMELKRNEVACMLGCVPSQINYVLSTRFKADMGYIVESRRGGGGYIIIRQVEFSSNDMITNIISGIGNTLDYASASAIIKSLFEYDIISTREANIMLVAISDKILVCEKSLRDKIRADCLKNMLIRLI